MAAVDYVEQEFFLSGTARVYDWSGSGTGVKVVAGPGDYVTRILVRRPSDPQRFSGNIEVRVLNATRGYDYGSFADVYGMTQRGDVWVGITSKPINVQALKHFDTQRYAPLNWANPAPARERCQDPSFYPVFMTGNGLMMRMFSALGLVPQTSWPESEDGLIWDMLAQLGLLLKSPDREQILPGFSKPWLFMTGVSQSSILIHTWIAAFHDRFRLPDGAPIFDGYLAIVGPALARLNQCSRDILLDDPRQKLRPPDVPFIDLVSEGEMWLSQKTQQSDVVMGNGGMVLYQVAGAAHMRNEIPGYMHPMVGNPTEEDLARARPGVANTALMKRIVLGFSDETDFVWAPLVRGAFRNLEQWAREGIAPPLAQRIQLDADGEVERDTYGNALGGVRLPYIEVPIASYRGGLSAGGLGAIIGTREPLPLKTLQLLYPDKSIYLAKFAAATDKLVEERWLLPEDGEAMKQAAMDTSLP